MSSGSRFFSAAAFNAYGKRHPVFFAGAFVGGRYLLGDSAVQLQAGKGWNQQRTAAFTAFGVSYGSSLGYWSYSKLYPRLFGLSRPLTTAVVDVLTQTPFLYFPMFYVVREAIYGGPNSFQHPADTLRGGLQKWKDNFKEDFKMTLLFWLPAHAFNFKYMPLHFRMPFIGTVGLLWTMGLSTYRSGCTEEDRDTSNEQIAQVPFYIPSQEIPGPIVMPISLVSPKR